MPGRPLVSVRFSKDMLARLRELAQRTGRTVPEVVRELVARTMADPPLATGQEGPEGAEGQP